MLDIPKGHTGDKTPVNIACVICGLLYTSTYVKEYSRKFAALRKYGEGANDPSGSCRKCSTKLRTAQQVAALQAKYGVTNISQIAGVSEKKRQAYLRHYGVPHCMHAGEVRDKQLQTIRERYGCDNVFAGDTGRERSQKGMHAKYGKANIFSGPDGVKLAQEGMLRRYGVKYTMQVPELRAKQAASVEATLGVKNPFQDPTIKKICQEAHRRYRSSPAYLAAVVTNQASMLSDRLPEGWSFNTPDPLDTHYEVVCPTCSSVWRVHKSNPWNLLPAQRRTCPTCSPLSMVEDTFANYLPTGVRCERKNRTVLSPEALASVGMGKVKNGLELDYYFPDNHLAVEINGRYFHSFELLQRTHPHWTAAEIKKYHWFKAAACSAAGIRLVTLWEDEATEKMREYLAYACGRCQDKIGARELNVVEVDNEAAQSFYARHHLQGGCNGAMSLGLQDNTGVLKACMTFGDPSNCRSRFDGLLLQRFATAGAVPGAASRLLKLAAAGGDSIISYSDNRYASGKLYETLGFNLLREYPPDYTYVKGVKSWAKNRLQLPMLRAQAAERGLSCNGTEAELASRLGYLRNYDCGKKTWVLPGKPNT